jgi:SEC-C motif-containing protein
MKPGISDSCYCGSKRLFGECCEPKLLGAALPITAEELMRSRYSAYVTRDVPYILETTSPRYRKYYNPKAIMDWASNSTWISLEILSSSEKRVKFVATYLDENGQLMHHEEDSRFEKIGERWYFMDGK